MIAGAQKAGTSSLKAMLEQHPDICSHRQLECDFFLDDSLDDWERYFKRYYAGKSRVILAKQAFFTRKDSSVEKLHVMNPKAHIVFILRDPLSRLRSAYQMDRKSWINFSIEDLGQAIDAYETGQPNLLHNTMIRPGDYADVARRLMKFFPRNQIHWFTFEQLKTEPVSICIEIFRAVGIRDDVTIMARKENVAHDLRSVRFHRIIQGLNTHPGIQKLKAQLPYGVVNVVRELTYRSNRKPVQAEPQPLFSKQLHKKLKTYYERSNKEFVSLTGYDLPW